jgi:hypothetical protein
MSLLTKIQDKLHGRSGGKTPDSAEESIKSFNNLPDSEKIKVYDYINSLINLHKEDE